MSLARRLASQSTIIFGGRLFGAGLIFLVQAFIARFWGAAILGEYLLIIAAVNLIAVAMPLGFQTVGEFYDEFLLLAYLLLSMGKLTGRHLKSQHVARITELVG